MHGDAVIPRPRRLGGRSQRELLAALHATQRRAAQLTAQVGTLTAALARMVALEEQARRRAEDCEARHSSGFGGFEGRHEEAGG